MDAGLLAGVRVTSSLWLTASGGVSFYRRSEDHDGDGDAIDGGSHAMTIARFVRVAMTWRMPGAGAQRS